MHLQNIARAIHRSDLLQMIESQSRAAGRSQGDHRRGYGAGTDNRVAIALDAFAGHEGHASPSEDSLSLFICCRVSAAARVTRVTSRLLESSSSDRFDAVVAKPVFHRCGTGGERGRRVTYDLTAACRLSQMVRRTLIRAKYLSLASTRVHDACGALVCWTMSWTAVSYCGHLARLR
jgi:hypothetical protein